MFLKVWVGFIEKFLNAFAVVCFPPVITHGQGQREGGDVRFKTRYNEWVVWCGIHGVLGGMFGGNTGKSIFGDYQMVE